MEHVRWKLEIHIVSACTGGRACISKQHACFRILCHFSTFCIFRQPSTITAQFSLIEQVTVINSERNKTLLKQLIPDREEVCFFQFPLSLFITGPHFLAALPTRHRCIFISLFYCFVLASSCTIVFSDCDRCKRLYQLANALTFVI